MATSALFPNTLCPNPWNPTTVQIHQDFAKALDSSRHSLRFAARASHPTSSSTKVVSASPQKSTNCCSHLHAWRRRGCLTPPLRCRPRHHAICRVRSATFGTECCIRARCPANSCSFARRSILTLQLTFRRCSCPNVCILLQ